MPNKPKPAQDEAGAPANGPAQPEERAALPKPPDLLIVAGKDSPLGIRALIALVRWAEEIGHPLLGDLQDKLRAFEMYEDAEPGRQR
jgi:hypothetical protein